MFEAINEKLKTRSGKAYLILWLVYWAGTLIFYLMNTGAVLGDPQERAAWVPFLYAGVIICIILGAFLCLRLFAFHKRPVSEEEKRERKKLKVWHVLLMIGMAAFWFLSAEMINNTDGLPVMEPKYVLANIAGYLIMEIIVFLLLNSVKLSLCILSGFLAYMDLVFYFVYLFRGEPFQLIDILSAATGFEVAGNYEFTLSIWPVVMTTMTLVICGVIFALKDGCLFRKTAGKIIMRVAAAALIIGGFFFFQRGTWNTDLGIVTDLWAPKKTYTKVGTNLGFFCVAKFMRNDPPDGYTIEKVEEIIENSLAEESPEKTEEIMPANIIVVMNESWADYRNNGDFETNIEVMPYYDSLSENTVKGINYVCISGGGTAKTEYEFLTGNSVKQYPGLVPYVNFYTHDQYSLVSTLKSQGYYTVAIHPNKGTNWNRDKAYKLLGFDEFLTINDFEDPLLIRGMVSDLSDYEKIIEVIKNKEDPDDQLFVFDVTMQNHGGYATDNYPLSVDIEGCDDEEAKRYLSLLKASDDALEYLVEELKTIEEPTMLLMFGDHYPDITGMEEFLSGTKKDELEVYEKSGYYATPFFVWTNYDSEEETGLVTSASFLNLQILERTGLSLTPFDEYREKLNAEIMAYDHLGYVDADKNFIPWSDAPEKINNLIWEYECLQYNALVETSNRKDSFFSFTNTEES